MNKKPQIRNHPITKITKSEKDKILPVQAPIIQEIPLRICINETIVAILMYTPGQEKELAAGYCFTEGIFPDAWPIIDFGWEKDDVRLNTINIRLKKDQLPQPTTSVNGLDFSESAYEEKNIIDQMLPSLKKINSQVIISVRILQSIESQIRNRQKLFSLTGATHAAFVFTCEGNYLFCCEDIARHNALDKAIGHALLENIDLSDKILCLSGRTNYSLIKKAARAQFPIVASVSAPTSMAVKISQSVGITLIGFLRSEEMNIYTGQQRIEELQ